MARRVLGISERDLERALLRKGVVALRAGAAVCADCGRTPLVGEVLHRFGDDVAVCSLCRPRRAGAPSGAEVVRLGERGQSVRLRTRAA